MRSAATRARVMNVFVTPELFVGSSEGDQWKLTGPAHRTLMVKNMPEFIYAGR